MNYTIHQSICINFLKVGSVSNSSVLQIGSAGVIHSLSNLYNTGGFTKPAEEAQVAGESPYIEQEEAKPIVPLAPPG